MTRIVLSLEAVTEIMARMDRLDNPLLVLELGPNGVVISIDHDDGTDSPSIVAVELPKNFSQHN
jgi:hypothetical protein